LTGDHLANPLPTADDEEVQTYMDHGPCVAFSRYNVFAGLGGRMLQVFGNSAELPGKDVRNARVVPSVQDVKAFEHLERINRANNLTFFLNGFNHMFKGPINSILLASELLKSYMEDLGDQFEELNDEPERLPAGFREAGISTLAGMPQVIHGINSSTHKLNQFVSHLSEFTGNGDISACSDVDINQLISLCASIAHHQACGFTNHFHLDLEPDLPNVSCNARQVSQVIHNLLINALFSLPDRSCGLVLSASCNRAAGCVQICVRDEGIGISPDLIQHIMEPFFSTWSDFGCMGLGLSVAQRIVHDHGGDLTIVSKPGKGTSILFSLPLHDKLGDFVPECNHA